LPEFGAREANGHNQRDSRGVRRGARSICAPIVRPIGMEMMDERVKFFILCWTFSGQIFPAKAQRGSGKIFSKTFAALASLREYSEIRLRLWRSLW
jgi:hypothetical protein